MIVTVTIRKHQKSKCCSEKKSHGPHVANSPSKIKNYFLYQETATIKFYDSNDSNLSLSKISHMSSQETWKCPRPLPKYRRELLVSTYPIEPIAHIHISQTSLLKPLRTTLCLHADAPSPRSITRCPVPQARSPKSRSSLPKSSRSQTKATVLHFLFHPRIPQHAWP